MASRTGLVLLLNVLVFTMISSSYAAKSCSLNNIFDLSVCGSLMGLVNVQAESPETVCCSIINGLVDMDATFCLCVAINANVFGIVLNVPLALDAVFSACGKTTAPSICPPL